MMRKIFKVERSANMDTTLLVIRIGIALLMLGHGLPKLGMLLDPAAVQFPDILGLGATTSLVLAVMAEVGCSLFLLFGFGTRVAAIPLIVTMVVAVFYIHLNDPFPRKELGLMYLMFYLLLLKTGSGKYSADYLLQRYYLRKAPEALQ